MNTISELASELIAKMPLPEEPADAARKIYAVVGAERAAAFADRYYEGALSAGGCAGEVRAILDEEAPELSGPCAGLASEIMLAEGCYRHIYQQRPAPNGKPMGDKVYFDTMSDIAVWAKTYLKFHGCWGYDQFGWLEHHLHGECFKLGRLQFQPVPFGHRYYSCLGRTATEDTPVWTIHIPETGKAEPFTQEACLDSLHRAYEFTGGSEIYTTDSWLLYPAHFQFLPADGNIRRFMELFDIIDDVVKPRPADMPRMFPANVDFEHPETLPRDTSLRRAYADWYTKTRVTGAGFGVIVYDGEKIISKPELYRK